MESEVFRMLSRLATVTGRVVLLARVQQDYLLIKIIYYVLKLTCHAMDIVEESLQGDE
jgi:hypothetical protein